MIGCPTKKCFIALKAVTHLSRKIPVFYTGIESPESIDKLPEFIHAGETVVFTGMSGVGKSTLINALCGQQVLQTGAISDSTGKGKHTSTCREMVLLPDITLHGFGTRETEKGEIVIQTYRGSKTTQGESMRGSKLMVKSGIMGWLGFSLSYYAISLI